MQIHHHPATPWHMLIFSSLIKRAKLWRFCPGSVREAAVIPAAQGRGTEPGDALAELFLKLTMWIEAQQVAGLHAF